MKQHGGKYFTPTHPQPGGGVKRSKYFFLKVVMLHIKLKGMGHRAWGIEHHPSTYSVYTHTLRPRGMVKTFFSESSHVAYQIKLCSVEHKASTYSVFTHTCGPSGAFKTFFSESSHVAYQIKGNGA